MPARRSSPSFAVVALLAGVGPLATDMYLPTLPVLGSDLGTSAAGAQLTLTAFIIGMAAGQVLLGPFIDATGRRAFALAGPAVFAASSAVCAVTASAGVFLTARGVQGLAAAAGMVAARAVVSDQYRGTEAARRFGMLSSIILLAPIVAPILGAAILLVGTWRTMFALLAAVGVAQVVGVLTRVPETLPRAERHPASLPATVARMGKLLRDWNFSGHVLVQSLAIMGFFSYIGGSAFALQDGYGMDASTYGLVFAGNAVFMAASSAAMTRLVVRFRVVRLRDAGLVLASLGAVVLLVAVVAAPDRLPPLWKVLACLPLVTAGMGLVIPASITIAQEAGHWARGTAAALQGGISFTCGALVTPLTGLAPGAALPVMAGAMAGFLVLAAVAARFAPDPR